MDYIIIVPQKQNSAKVPIGTLSIRWMAPLCLSIAATKWLTMHPWEKPGGRHHPQSWINGYKW